MPFCAPGQAISTAARDSEHFWSWQTMTHWSTCHGKRWLRKAKNNNSFAIVFGRRQKQTKKKHSQLNFIFDNCIIRLLSQQAKKSTKNPAPKLVKKKKEWRHTEASLILHKGGASVVNVLGNQHYPSARWNMPTNVGASVGMWQGQGSVSMPAAAGTTMAGSFEMKPRCAI